MTLTDAGPLIALIDADEPDHATCVMALRGLRLPLVTTWPAFTEAMYLLGRAAGIRGQRQLWRLVHTNRLVVADLLQASIERSSRLMEQYQLRRLPVVDGDGRICGVVAQADIAKKGPSQIAAEVVQRVSEPNVMASAAGGVR